jgi:ABC-type multidrug transport system fused ATPase/permease subunit
MQIMAMLPNCETVYHILKEKIATIEDGSREMDTFKSKIEFNNVTFAYKERDKILECISLTFEKGRTTAIVGGSGSGKTTVINLVLRLFDVGGGSIEIDGVDIRQYRLASWLGKIGFVSQETIIFNDTVRNNITFGSDYSDEEIVRVCQYANAHGFISELPRGYETLVGDRGMRLSGGQKQRIAVARAMIRNPEILIFDEATNALDNISEAAVQRAIDEIARDHTVIIIAHRLSTIVNADKIIVIGDGRVLEEGRHNELIAKGGAYSDLYRSQVNS